MSQYRVVFPFGREGLPRSLRISRKRPESRFDFLELENSVGALKSQRRRLGAGLVGSHTAPEMEKSANMADMADMAPDMENIAICHTWRNWQIY